MKNNDCVCCDNNYQSIENNKSSISFIVNDYINTKKTNTTPTNNSNNNNNNNNNKNNNDNKNHNDNDNKNKYPSRNFLDPVTNSNRRYYVKNFLQSVCDIRNQPYNKSIHRNAIEKICDCKKLISNEILIYNSLKMKTGNFLNMTNFINDCSSELRYLDSFKTSLEKDIQMFSNEIITINVPNSLIPTPVLPPLIVIYHSALPLFTFNTTNLQNQIACHNLNIETITTPTNTSQTPPIDNIKIINKNYINNNVTGVKVLGKRRSKENNNIVKEAIESCKKTRTINQTPVGFIKQKRIRKLKLTPGDC